MYHLAQPSQNCRRVMQLIPEALAATQNAFFSGSMTTSDGRVSLPAVRQCAQVIQRASSISADGFGNLRFAALANVPAGSPFFPAAYHQGGEPTFALATEAADLAVTCVQPVWQPGRSAEQPGAVDGGTCASLNSHRQPGGKANTG